MNHECLWLLKEGLPLPFSHHNWWSTSDTVYGDT